MKLIQKLSQSEGGGLAIVSEWLVSESRTGAVKIWHNLGRER